MGFGTIPWRPNSDSCHYYLPCTVTHTVCRPTVCGCTFCFQIDLCGMPNLIINRVIRREPVGLAYLKRFIMSMDSPTIAPSALSSMTLNFDASLSSSICYESRSLPATPTCVYVRSPDLLLNKSKGSSVTDSGELFVSALQAPLEYDFVSTPQEPKLMSQDVSSEQNGSNNLHLNTNSNCNKVEQQQPTSHVQQRQQENEPQLLTKSRKYINNLALAANHSGSIDNSMTSSGTNSQKSQNVIFTLSAGSDASGLGSDRDAISNTVSSTGNQPSVEESDKSAEAGSESLEVPQLSNSNF